MECRFHMDLKTEVSFLEYPQENYYLKCHCMIQYIYTVLCNIQHIQHLFCHITSGLTSCWRFCTRPQEAMPIGTTLLRETDETAVA